MSKTFKILVGVLLMLIAALVFLESSQKDPVNWFSSYATKDKIPYGTFVLYNTLKEARGADDFKEISRPPYEFLSDSNHQKGTYFFVNDYISFDEIEALQLLDWVARGNTLYIGARGIGKTILDTLSLETDSYYQLDNLDRKPLLELAHPDLVTKVPYALDRDIQTSYFEEVDTLNTYVLGMYDYRKDEDTLSLNAPKVHFIKQAFEEGTIVIHLMPDVFTNYFMLHNTNYTYTEAALKYLPEEGPIFWDNHYKNGKTLQTSRLRYLLSNRYFKWAYYMLIIGVILWIFFEGKRKQRAIPIIKPLPNQTLAFTKTIAGMYYEKQDHKSIALHQINHFMEYIREHYLLQTSDRGLDFIGRLASKSNNTQEDTKRLMDYITAIGQKYPITQEELLKLNKLIEAFKTK
ncbi:hypothetical protein GCM10011344_07510 [Dokdonia pacifica]|uniref:DUF4350 domain-containing protein n=1 Tax=Dokdonia pacifica TaxID=1627892 RepID=A0A238YZH1_9FLAO|nr:DUF4350 domain-containing protein [Dokdonia pacifica]GGG09446.1 hypothetical protein GCM10011344_07510 [Dokdonia pacifica]SNR75959.1 protein of unknown function [Dokdonia pacifica]